jgi:HSP90 family molecular chaperone
MSYVKAMIAAGRRTSTLASVAQRSTRAMATRSLPMTFAGRSLRHKGVTATRVYVRSLGSTRALAKDGDDKNDGTDDAKIEEGEVEEDSTPPAPAEEAAGPATDFEFQAETRKLLDIVAQSLYSDKEVFIREIVSNASDALEKLRYQQVTEQEITDADTELAIKITTDEDAGTFTIHDSGIGMTKDELIANLGCIARSGTKNFVEGLEGDATKSNMIGQFGVGFYSTFMVGHEVTVYSKSATPGETGHVWTSDGSGKYSISEANNVSRGTKIVIRLNDRGADYAKEMTVQDVLEKHSNFVGFPVHLNGKHINTVEPMWTRAPSTVTKEEHTMFYRFVAGAFDEPLFTLHYSVDAPLQMRTLFYVPTMHSEKMGMGRLEPGVSLYCRKVLVLDKAPTLLPDWLRFIKGVVDSEDIPLNLSRELLQDSALIARISSLLAARLVRFFADQAKREPEKYLKFYDDFGNFLREGACTDYSNQADIMKLMRYESSQLDAKEHTSLEEYLERIPEDQDKIYYIVCPTRDIAENSPYMEALLQKGVEVLYCYEPFDDVVFNNVRKYKGKQFVSVETNQVEIDTDTAGAMPAEELTDLCAWMTATLGDKRVSKVVGSARLVTHPALISDEIGTGTVRRMMRTLDPENLQSIAAQTLEVNPSHNLIKALGELRERDPGRAELILEQMYDNAMVYAGLVDDPRPMIARVNRILEGLATK